MPQPAEPFSTEQTNNFCRLRLFQESIADQQNLPKLLAKIRNLPGKKSQKLISINVLKVY